MRRPRADRPLLFLGAVCAVLAILIFLVLPDQALYTNGRRHSGDLFRGFEALFGNAAARYFMALPFGILACVLVRDAFFQEEELPPGERGSQGRKDRR